MARTPRSTALASSPSRSKKDPPADAEPLLGTVMTSETVTAAPLPTLTAICDYCASQLRALPKAVRRLTDPAIYPVSYSDRLLAVQRSLKTEIEALEVRGAG